MKSIFSTFKGLHKDGKPLDFLATWKKTFDKASERETILFQKMYCAIQSLLTSRLRRTKIRRFLRSGH